jgi:hypothetical protein
MRTLEEVRLDVHIENIAAQALDRVVEWQNVHTLSVFDIKALVDIDEVAKLDAKIVTCNLVHLYTTFLDIIRTQTDQDGVSPLLPAEATRKAQKLQRRGSRTNRTMIVSPRKS